MTALPETITVTLKVDTAEKPKEEQSAPSTTAATPAPAAEAPAPSAQLDLAFCCDCTGSMGAYIRSAQENILRITEAIHARCAQRCDLQYGLVQYRDHPPQDSTFITKTLPLTHDVQAMKAEVDTMRASGGGDGPEAVAAALHAVSALQWRPNATKVAVLISDAPPHGLGESGDGFPNGCPDGHDPIALCKEMAAKGIVVYAVGVEPVLSTNYKFARDFMMAVAKITEGKFLPLGQAQILSDVIVAGAVEGMEMEALWADLELKVAEEAKAKGEQLAEDDLIGKVSERLEAEKSRVQMQHIEVTNPYMDEEYDEANVEALVNASSLSTGQRACSASRNKSVAQKSAGYAWHAQEARCAPSSMTETQQTRMVSKACKRRGM